MNEIIDIVVHYTKIHDNEEIEKEIAKKLTRFDKNIHRYEIIKRSIDARHKQIYFNLKINILDKNIETNDCKNIYQNVRLSNKKVIIIGAGPAGYFAALELIKNGIKPIVVERGKDVQARRKDLRNIQQFGEVNAHSNYCFGEGGAGTYSDGKLYTRSHKRGNIDNILRELVSHGAKSDILVDTHPHIGSNKLPLVIQNIRNTILEHGGEVHFEHWVNDFIIKNNKIIGVVVHAKNEIFADAVIVATGHSARDIFYLFNQKELQIEFKPFALGVRIEHPQALIDEIQYGQRIRHENLPAASYSLVCQVESRGVFSFCMCPGGLIVPSATSCNEIVVNGMSMSRRDSAFANSGIAVTVNYDDIPEFHRYKHFAGLAFQEKVEHDVFNALNMKQTAPAQNLLDFTSGKLSRKMLPTSYIPGVSSYKVNELLPKFISKSLQEGLINFGKKMRGYYTEQAQVLATESRTSSPIRLPRTAQGMHSNCEALFPCGEGAGYAGGIISAALDGENTAKKVAEYLNS